MTDPMNTIRDILGMPKKIDHALEVADYLDRAKHASNGEGARTYLAGANVHQLALLTEQIRISNLLTLRPLINDLGPMHVQDSLDALGENLGVDVFKGLGL